MATRTFAKTWPIWLAIGFITSLILLALLLKPPTSKAAGAVSDCSTFGPGVGTLQAALSEGGLVSFGCSGTIIVPNTIVITTDTRLDATGQQIILSGNNSIRLFTVESGITFQIENLTLTNARNNGNGGAIFSDGGDIQIGNSRFISNGATAGGAIYVTSNAVSRTLNISNSVFTSNTASSSDGGGALYSSGLVNVNLLNSIFETNRSTGTGAGITYNGTSLLNIINSNFTGNVANGIGGGIYLQIGLLNIINADFVGNRASQGGGLYLLSGLASIANAKLERNTANSDGGGLYTRSNFALLTNSQIISNVAANGAGIYSKSSVLSTTLNIVGSTVANNIATSGGAAIYNGADIISRDTIAAVNIYNSTISTNTVSNGRGGAILNTTGSAFFGNIIATNIANSTLSGNRATDGGGVYNMGGGSSFNVFVTMTNATVYNNVANSNNGNNLFNNVNNNPTRNIISLTNSLIVGTNSANCTGAITDGGNNLQYLGTSCGNTITSADPLLASLADNGGLTLTHALSNSSPAINNANDEVCGQFPIANVDQRGLPRNDCDIGAFEKQVVASPPILSKSFVPTSVSINQPFRMDFFLTNPNTTTVLTNVGFTDTLPSGFRYYLGTPSSNCSTPGTIVRNPGQVVVTGVGLNPGETCNIAMAMTTINEGPQTNIVNSIYADQTGTTAVTASATLSPAQFPLVNKEFNPNRIGVGLTSTLQITLTNPNNTTALTGVSLTDSLPDDVRVAAIPNLVTPCSTPGNVQAAPNSQSIVISGVGLVAGEFCIIKVDVTSATTGSKFNIITIISSDQSGATTTTASASLLVLDFPIIRKAFVPSTIAQGLTSTLQITLTNPNANMGLTNISFVDAMPSQIKIAASPNISTSCSASQNIVAIAGTSLITVSGVTLSPSQNCRLDVSVTSNIAGSWSNTTSPISSFQTGIGQPSNTAILTVTSVCNLLLVTSPLDDNTCGTLRYAVNNASIGSVISITAAAGSVISLTQSLTLTNGLTINGNCGANGPQTIINGNGTLGNGLVLGQNNLLFGLQIRGFVGQQIVVLSGGNNRLRCVIARR